MKINDIDYNIKFNLRSMLLFEQITGKIFEIKTLTDEYILFYACILANNKDTNMTFDGFLNHVDEHPELFIEFSEILKAENERRMILMDQSKKK